MKYPRFLLPVFIGMVLAQLYVPAKMILDREAILKVGKEFKFKTAPVDPNDLLRGKYIFLDYEHTEIEIDSTEEWETNETVYLTFTTDQEGFARIKSISKDRFRDTPDYLEAQVDYSFSDTLLFVYYSFDRYYMEESKAYDAELLYRESQFDSNQVAYALVHIKDGDAVLKDVMIDGVPIRELVKKEQAETSKF